MKKYFTKTLMLLAATMMAACSSDNDITGEPQQPTAETTPITITARYGDDAQMTRVAYSENGNNISATWESDDQIYVVYDGQVSTLTLESGAGTGTATFTGTISHTNPLTASSLLVCYVKDKNNASALTINDGKLIYSDAAFTSQDGTLASAAKCNTYSGTTTYGSGENLTCNFGVSTAICKFTLKKVSSDAGKSATVVYKSSDSTLASATFEVTSGDNLIYLAIPAGSYSGEQILVYTCSASSYEHSYVLSTTKANFTAGNTYSKDVFPSFFVSSSQMVCFSSGNLQYKSGEDWRFAENQWDYFGACDTSDWIDLFGWGTWGNGKNPCQISAFTSDYKWSTDFKGTLAGYDDWYTLSADEWQYLFNNCAYGLATVNSVTGIILLPDGSGLSINTVCDQYTDNQISKDDWNNTYETRGAVFLPAAGFRVGTVVHNSVYQGYYWSSSASPYGNDNSEAFAVYFCAVNEPGNTWSTVKPNDSQYRHFGESVRLVRKVK